ncbi:MAG TPA: hypothetical protein VIE46_04265 [Gemmatimonadales bacterium]
MAQLFDRLNRELETFGKRAQAALDDGKLQIELLRHRRQQDRAALELGMLVYRRERGGEVEARRIDAVMLRLDDLTAEITRLEERIAARKGSAAAGAPPQAADAVADAR